MGLFFFSSRRRHTRCSRDWSSDVCSSDLESVLRARNRSRLPQLRPSAGVRRVNRSEEHTSELQSRLHLVCRLLLEKKKIIAPTGFETSCASRPIVHPARLPLRINANSWAF